MQETADDRKSEPRRARFLTLKYCGASLCGFAVDLIILKLMSIAGLPPAWARVISLFTAMQVTFCINGLIVFKSLEWPRAHRQWAAYMLTNSFGNLCNFLAFTTLLSLHRTPWSNHVFAVTVGAFTAWVVNYAGTRLIVFNPKGRHFMERIRQASGHVVTDPEAKRLG